MARSAAALAEAREAAIDPAREALSAAISRLALAKRRVAASKAAVDGFYEHRFDAQAVVEAAEAAFEVAKAAMVDATVDGASVPSIRDAKGALEDARDVLNALNGGEERLAAGASAAEGALMLADMNLGHAVRAVVKSDARITKLVADFRVAQREYVSLQWIMNFLDGKNALPDGTKGWDCNQREWPELASIPVAWKAAFAALERDANAQLPGD